MNERYGLEKRIISQFVGPILYLLPRMGPKGKPACAASIGGISAFQAPNVDFRKGRRGEKGTVEQQGMNPRPR